MVVQDRIMIFRDKKNAKRIVVGMYWGIMILKLLGNVLSYRLIIDKGKTKIKQSWNILFSGIVSQHGFWGSSTHGTHPFDKNSVGILALGNSIPLRIFETHQFKMLAVPLIIR